MADYIELTKQAIDMTGQNFGRLTALGPVSRDVKHGIIWRAICECGKAVTVRGEALRSGVTQSCGCLGVERRRAATRKHGMSNTQMHKAWSAMKDRCNNPNNSRYADYGGRGIAVCEEWSNSFEDFYNHVSKIPQYGSPGVTLDRIDNDGPYSPDNCRWASKAQQLRNTRRNHMITYRGETKCLTDWGDALNVHPSTLAARIAKGWSVERSFTTIVAPSHRWGGKRQS